MNDILKIKIKQANLYSRRVSTRIPFKFGSSLVTEMPVILAQIVMETSNGKMGTGVSSCGIPPGWFDKSRDKTAAQGEKDLLDAALAAIDLQTGSAPDTAWNLHRNTDLGLRNNSALKNLNDLTLSFGSALMDNALIDAICRTSGTTFHQALKKKDLSGDQLGAHIPALRDGVEVVRSVIHAFYDPKFNFRDWVPQSG